jgi:uncharacterized membrane protein
MGFVSRYPLALILLLGLGLRLWRIDAALWYDEAFSAWLARLPLVNLIEAALGDVHPPLYYLILAGVTHLVGHSEAALRLPSLLAGLGLIWLVYRLASALGQSRETALVAALLCAISPFQVYYSQEARPYALVMLAYTAAVLGMVERRTWLLVAGSVLALYLNNMSVVFVGCLFAGYVTIGEGCRYPSLKMAIGSNRDDLLWLIRAGGLIGLAYAPGAAMAWQQAANVGAGYWIPAPGLGRIVATLDDLLFFMPSSPLVVSGLITGLLIIAILSDSRAGNLFLMALVALPLALVWLISVTWQPILITRSMAALGPLWLILVAGAVTRRLVTFGSSVAIIAICVMIVPSFAPSVGRQPVDRAMISMYAHFQPGEAIYHANVGSYVVWAYYRPDVIQYLLPQQTTIRETLSRETRIAMGMRETDFKFIKCTLFVTGKGTFRPLHWWLIDYANPQAPPSERAGIEAILASYPAEKIATLKEDAFSTAALYRIDPGCNPPPQPTSTAGRAKTTAHPPGTRPPAPQ